MVLMLHVMVTSVDDVVVVLEVITVIIRLHCNEFMHLRVIRKMQHMIEIIIIR